MFLILRGLLESLPVGFRSRMQVDFRRSFSIIIVIFKLIFRHFRLLFIFPFGSIAFAGGMVHVGPGVWGR